MLEDTNSLDAAQVKTARAEGQEDSSFLADGKNVNSKSITKRKRTNIDN